MRGLGSGHVTCGPMRGLEINYAGRGRSYNPAEGHCDSMTESAQWANSEKSSYIEILLYFTQIYIYIFSLACIIYKTFCDRIGQVITSHSSRPFVGSIFPFPTRFSFR